MNSVLFKRYFVVILLISAIITFVVVAYLRRPKADVSGPSSSAPGVIWGRVTDSGGKPLPGIVVSLGSNGIVSGPQGGYLLVTDTFDAQVISFHHTETHEIYKEVPSEEAIIVVPGQSTNYNFVLSRLEIQPTPITAFADPTPSPTVSSSPASAVSPSVAPAPKPAQPTNLATTAKQNPRRVELKWRDNANNETGFIIARTESKTALVKFFEVPANSTSYNDATAERGKTYFYKVRAFSGTGSSKSYSTYSNESKVTAK